MLHFSELGVDTVVRILNKGRMDAIKLEGASDKCLKMHLDLVIYQFHLLEIRFNLYNFT